MTKSHALDHVMGIWFGAMALTALFVGLSPAQEAVASVNHKATVRIWYATAAEKHCMIQTMLGEATPNHKAEVIGLMRGMLRRREMGRWGNLCGVAKAPKQFSVWNNKRMPKKPRKPSKQYKRYAEWAELALMAGPNRFDSYWHGKAMKQLYGRNRPYWAKACKETVKIGGATMCRMV